MEDELKQEIKNLKILLVAAIRTNGGELVVEDRHICDVTEKCTMRRFNDSEKNRIVLKA